MLAGAAAVGAAGVIGGPAAAQMGSKPQTNRTPVEFTWFGNHAWQIRSGEHTVLTDPWLTRFHTGTFTPEGADPQTKLVIDKAVVDKHIIKADAILVHHAHYDHMTDVPYVAAKTQATVLGTQTHVNLLKAMRTQADLLSPVRGGEYLVFDGFTIEVYPSLHSCSGKRHTYAFPGYHQDAVPARPRVIADLVEGGTLAYVITIGGLRILSLSTANFDPNALRDLQVDVVMIAPGGEPGVTDRLFQTIKPLTTALATHWDDFDKPLTEPGVPWADLTPLRTSAEKTGAKFVIVDHLKTLTL
jgi:L-ascorbate metabolism protein UlaG (beta-lactamase superfamily)